MTTKEILIEDYLIKLIRRLLALEFLRDIEAYADVVREAQEVLDAHKIHDISKYI